MALLLAAAALPGCKDSTGSRAGPAAAMAVVGGNTQTGTVGAELAAPLAVKVTDARGRPVKGQTVKFVVTAGGGHTFLGTATTDDQGVAQDRWTLGTVAGGAQTLEAQAVDPSTAQVLATATFTATAAAGAPATVTPVGDTLVAGVAGTVVEDTFGVLVRDQYGNPVPGAQVAWSVQEGGGTIVTPAPTGANGISRTQWVLGPNATVRQRAAATLAGQTVRYTAGVATALNKVAGDGQTAGAGTVITVKVTASTPVAGLPVHWQVTGGGGSVTPAVSAAGSFDPAVAEWTLGPGGAQTLTASAGNLSVTFTATSIAQGQRTLLSTVPGLVLDATADRVAWQDNAGNIAVRTIATGADQFVRNDPYYQPTSGQPSSGGKLFSTGLVLWDIQAQLFDWHPGSLAYIGAYNGYSADGDWLAWWFASGTGVMLRHLTDRNTITVPGTQTAIDGLDVAPDGGVAYVTAADRTLRTYRNGVTTARYTAPQSVHGLGAVVLDGDNVVVRQIDFNGGVEVLLVLPSGVESLGFARASDAMAAAGGWTAWSRTTFQSSGDVTEVWRRSPAGTRLRLNDPALGPAQLEALSPNGSVAFRAGNPQTFFIVDAAGNYRGAGTYASGDRIVWRDGHFVLIHNANGTGSVYDLGS